MSDVPHLQTDNLITRESVPIRRAITKSMDSSFNTNSSKIIPSNGLSRRLNSIHATQKNRKGLLRPTRPQFYQTRSAWSKDEGSTKKRSAVHNFVPTVTKFCVLWEGLSLPHDTKFGNCRGEIVDRRVIFIWSLILGSSWSGLIKVGPDLKRIDNVIQIRIV